MDDNREVIELVNKLQSYQSTGCKIDIQLPQIVVVGAQSSGKSSVLDGLIGHSILPRGSGTVTKCPIIVQLVTITDPDKSGIEFQDDVDSERSKDYDFVRRKLNEKMNANDGAISHKPIIIRVYSCDVVTLTVVDLPGIKRLTSDGEPSDLEQLIFSLSRKYINEQNAIILAVSPANYDICNSDGLLLAKEADPHGKRTLGVLTKLDLMDEGTNARDLLTGTSKDVEVRLGMIGLVNRSQKDIKKNLSIESQLEKERHFLEKKYPDLASVNGVPYLRKRLHELLVKHILKCLPVILENMEGLLEGCTERLEGIPDVMTDKDKRTFVDRIIYKFENNVKTEIEGSARSPEYEYLYGGIKIKDAFETEFLEDLKRIEKRSDSYISDEKILTAFRNSAAYDSFFVNPEAVFRKLAQNQVKLIQDPALKCANRVYEEIQIVVNRNLKSESALEFFPDLRKTIKSVVNKMIDGKLEEVEALIKDYIRIQGSIVFSLDAEFLSSLGNLRRQLERKLHGCNNEGNREEGLTSGMDEFSISEEPVVSETDMESAVRSSGQLAQLFFNGNGSAAAAIPFVPPLRRPKALIPKSSSGERLFAQLEGSGTTQLIKKMVKFYFSYMIKQCQDYIPKLISDRLITQFSSDGSLGNELRNRLHEEYSELAKLPVNMQEQRKKDTELRKRLKEIISEVKEILENHRYEEDEEDEEI